MPSVHFNEIDATSASNFPKHNMMMSEEEEESATLAEPMTVEGAKQLAQSNVSTTPTPPAVLNISPGLPTVSPPMLSSPRIIHPILPVGQLTSSRSPMLHPLTSPPGTAPHPLLMTGHLTSPTAQFSVLSPGLWAPPTMSHDDEEISEYPSTVDLQAIRDSPSPEPLPNGQANSNRSWNGQDSNKSDSHADDSSSDDESDSSDSDTSSSNSGSSSSDCSNKTEEESDSSKAIGSRSSLLPRSQSRFTDSESSDSESDQDSDDDGTSSNDESSASSDVDRKPSEIGFPKVNQPSATIHSIQQIILKEHKDKLDPQACVEKPDQSQAVISPISPTKPKSLENPVAKKQTSTEKSVPVKTFTKSLKSEKETCSGQVASEDFKKTCNVVREKLSSSSKTTKQSNESLKVPGTGSDLPKKKILQPRMYSPTELERRRIAKKKELDQEFDRLLKSSEEQQEGEGSDVDCVLENSDDVVCSDSIMPIKSDCDKSCNVSKNLLSNAHSNTPANKLASANQDKTEVNTRGSQKCDELREKTISKRAPSTSKYSARKKYDSTDSDDSSLSRETSPVATKAPIRPPSPPSPVQKTIADTVKIRERRTSLDTASSSGEKESEAYVSKKSHRKKRAPSKSTEESSLSDASEELNEKVDLDTEQTQTFSVSENNFNQGRLTMKIAAMKMAKFGKTGLREVTAGGFPTRSDSYGPFEGSDVIPKRHLNRNPKSEIQKVKTAAERKTYVDPVPASSETNSRSKKKNNKERMRVPASAFYRNANRNGDEDQISRIADDLSEISDQHLGDSLQVLNQDDLAALLSDENGHQASSSVGLYNFKENNATNHPRDSDLPDAIVQEAINSIALLTQSSHVPLNGIFNDKSSESTKKASNVKKWKLEHKRPEKVLSHPNSPEESAQPTNELETYTPLEHNALNVSPDSGIQSVNGSPLHPVGSPHHRSPFYSSGLIEAGISASNCGENKAPSEEQGEPSLNRSFSPTFSHRDSPSPPTLLPAVTPPHLCRSPRYYSDGPDSPPMPVLKCQVDHPPWEVSDSEKPPEIRPPSPKEEEPEDTKPKRSRGRPKGSKNLKKPLDQIWSIQTKDSSIEGSRRKSSKPLHLSNRTPIESKNPDSQENVPVKRGPGRPKKIKDPESKSEKIDGRKHRRLKIKRPVGRPRRQPAADSVDNKCLPVTLASRKCFSEKIMHKIINEKVRNSEKSDKLAVEGKEEDLPSELHGLKDRRSEDERGRKTKRKSLIKKLCGDGIPLVEERKKKRGRRKELPAIFGKVYGSVKFGDKADHARGISPASHTSFKKKKKHKKSFKSKHKNIIDPVFLAELEDLMVDFSAKCAISKPLGTPLPVTGEAPLPSIFRRRKVVLPTKKKSRIDKAKTNDKESGTEGDVREKLAGKRKKKVLEPPKQGRERSEANEQRLPLKKRHRHISTGVSVCTDPPKIEQSRPDTIKNHESKDKSTITKAPFDSVKNIKAENKAAKSNQETKLDTSLTTKKKTETKSSTKDQFPTDIMPAKFTPLNVSYAEENRKKDATYQSMVSTTPKKRHRLEADASAKKRSAEQTIEAPRVLITEPSIIKSSQVVTRIKVEQESDKTISENEEVPSCIENVSEPVKSSIPPCETAAVKPNEPVDEGTHSDSDIPSEHEPLGESDHSGFMSDKEETKGDDIARSPKRRKRKREYRLPKKITEEPPKETKDVKITPPVHRKKRRKTNRTGFPTVRRKKKIKIDSKENESPVILTSDQAASLDPKVCIEPLSISDAAKFSKIKGEHLEAVRPRGRPRKTPCTEDVKLKSENDDVKSRKRKETDEDPKHGENKRPRRSAEEEIEDSDVLPVSEISSEPVSSDECSRVTTGRQKAPRFKKKYLVAGLLSNYYKQDDFSQRKNVGTCGRPKLQYEPQQHVHGLLPPPSYCKKQLRETVIDFTLPYDLWWLNKHNRLPGRDPVPSWNYKKVKANVYYDVKPTHEFDIQACNCKRPSKPDARSCDEDCINRVMFIECSPQTCPVNDTCSNQRLQKHENLTCLQKFKTEDKGWGIKATTEIKQGSFIMEYVGEVVSEKEFRYRMQTRYVNDTHHYCLNLDRGMMIDGHRIGSDCRFVNHSCAPNCEMQKWNVNGQYRMALFALKDIPEADELTYDYNFHLFNPSQGQPCKCREENCRGVIGGRSQRVNNVTPPEEKRKTSGRNKKEASKKRKRGASTDTEGSCVSRSQFMPMKPLSHQQRLFILAHRCFLLRNLEKIRKSRDRVARYQEKKVEEPVEPTEEPCNKIQRFQTHFTALNTARSVKTRRLAQVEDDPEMTRLAKLAQIFKDIYDKLFASRDDKDKPLAAPFMTVPSKKKYPAYYSRVGEPIDLSLIEKNISTGHYTSAESFDGDVMRLFANNLRFFGRNTEIGQMAVGLRKVYSECKLQFKPLLEEVLGEDHLPAAFSDCAINEEFEDEDVIRCVCNLYRDEGTMIQCERCLVWQHCDCMSVSETDFPEHYLCEECSPRIVSPEVPMTPQPADSSNKKHFVTLLRDNLQIKQGDSVYILRDPPTQKPGERRQPAYKLAKDIKFHELLIFKVESLFIDEKGDKYAFGHHYLRPHETFHEPMRKFYANEVIRSPYCEILALDMIIKHCWVMDLNSYCRGRPIGAVEEHVYVCEFRVDKSAHVFSKISKPKYPICKKPYAFITFQEKLRPQKTYTPHEVIFSRRSKHTSKVEKMAATVKEEGNSKLSVAPDSAPATPTPPSRNNSGTRKCRNNASSRDRSENEAQPEEPPPPVKEKTTDRTKKRVRVNQVATRLLRRLPTKGAVDLAYLLENNKRQRKKTTAFAS